MQCHYQTYFVWKDMPYFLELVKINDNFANEQEIMSLINVKIFDDVISFAKKINKLIVVTRGDKGAIAIDKNGVAERSAKNLKIKDLTGAGDLFAGGFLHGLTNNKSTKESLETEQRCPQSNSNYWGKILVIGLSFFSLKLPFPFLV